MANTIGYLSLIHIYSNQRIGDVEPQATITTIPLTLILTAHLCAPVTIITVTFKKRCF